MYRPWPSLKRMVEIELTLNTNPSPDRLGKLSGNFRNECCNDKLLTVWNINHVVLFTMGQVINAINSDTAQPRHYCSEREASRAVSRLILKLWDRNTP